MSCSVPLAPSRWPAGFRSALPAPLSISWVACWGPWRASPGARLPCGHVPEPRSCPSTGFMNDPFPRNRLAFQGKPRVCEDPHDPEGRGPCCIHSRLSAPSPGPACPLGSPGPHRAPPDALRCSPSWQQESARVCGLQLHARPCLLTPTEAILGVTRPEAPTPSCKGGAFSFGTACLAKVEARGQVSWALRGGFGGQTHGHLPVH